VPSCQPSGNAALGFRIGGGKGRRPKARETRALQGLRQIRTRVRSRVAFECGAFRRFREWQGLGSRVLQASPEVFQLLGQGIVVPLQGLLVSGDAADHRIVRFQHGAGGGKGRGRRLQ